MNRNISIEMLLLVVFLLAACSAPTASAVIGTVPQQQPDGGSGQIPQPLQPAGVQPDQQGQPAEQVTPIAPHSDSEAHTHTHEEIDLHHLPVGDGYFTTDGAQIGSVNHGFREQG